MTNFVLVHLRLEDKTIKTLRTCHECGEQFRSQRTRKYCSKRCSMEQSRRNNINPFSKRTVTDKADRLERPIDPDSYGHGCVGVAESHNPFDAFDLSDGMMQEDMFYINRQMALAYRDNEIQRRKRRKS
tara:strand:- start:2074 stop:2460 length:387 start_codon:yes stop_codon:yes gene_type:complete